MTFRKTLLIVVALVAVVALGNRASFTNPLGATTQPAPFVALQGNTAPSQTSGDATAYGTDGSLLLEENEGEPNYNTNLNLPGALKNFFRRLLAPIIDPIVTNCVFPVCGGAIVGTPGVGTHANNGCQACAFDIRADQGTPVTAVVDGEICGRWGVINDSCALNSNPYGARLHLCGNDGNDYYYQHMGFLAPLGTQVKAGDIIGYIDWPTNPHLHIALFLCDICPQGEGQDPSGTCRDRVVASARCQAFSEFIRTQQSCPLADLTPNFPANDVDPPSQCDTAVQGSCTGQPPTPIPGGGGGGPGPGPGTGPTHNTCAGSACVEAPGEGFDECDSDAECVTSHTTCLGYQCVVTPEPGIDRCETDADCLRPRQDGSHRACRNLGLGGQCAVVPGFGDDTCDSDQDCNEQPEPEPGPVPGEFLGACEDPDPNITGDEICTANGTSEIACNTDVDCRRTEHTDCRGAQNLQCRVVPGPGINTCGAVSSPDSTQCGCSGLAQQLLNHQNVSAYSGSSSCNADCGAGSYECRVTHPVAELTDLAQTGCMNKFALPGPGPGSQSWSPCSSGPACPAVDSTCCNCRIQQLLQALVDYADSGGEFRITSIGGATAHMCNSDHYKGQAIDIVPENGWQRAIDFFKTRVYTLNECDHLHLKVDFCGETGTSTMC